MTAVTRHPVDLEPSLLAFRTYGTRRRRARIDAASLLSIMICLLYALPATLIVPGLTFAGRPALLIAFVLWSWWLISRLDPRLAMVGPQPMRWAVLGYFVTSLLAFLAGMLRGLPQAEANALDFTMILTVEFLGVVLIAADGIPNWSRLVGVLRIYVWSAGFMAVVGIIQATTAINIVEYFQIPGLEFKSEIADFQMRGDGGLFRVAATATHYIEFSTVMAMAVPFAIHFVRFGPTKPVRRAAMVVALLMTAAIPMAVSRTGVLALVTAITVMLVAAWNWRTRYNVLAIGLAIVAALTVLRPGLIGTIKSMFSIMDSDPSVTGRTDDYGFVGLWFSQRPWLGRGPGTLLPENYIILDNQWLYTLVTGGLVGVAAFAALHIIGIALATIALRRSTRPEDRHLCAAVVATQIVSLVVSATFDSLAFTTFSFTLALTLGLSGAVWRLTHPQRTVRTSSVRWLSDRIPAPRRISPGS